MAFNANIPLSTDQLSISQGDLLNNFQALATLLNPNTGSVTFVNQVGAPTFPAGQTGLYALTNTLTNKSELYINKNNQAGTVGIPLTASILGRQVLPANDVVGWTYLPSGILMKWNQVTGPVAAGIVTAVAIPSSAIVPAFNNLFAVFVNVQAGGTGAYTVVQSGITGANSFQILSSTGIPAGGFVNYLAIGN